MPHSYIAYIDESGDDGFRQFRETAEHGGTSHWLTLACCIVSAETDKLLPSLRDRIGAPFVRKKKRDLHFTNLNHDQRVHVCKEMAAHSFRLIAVMSNKTTIPTHPRKDLFQKKNTLYWYLARYVIERISLYCQRRLGKGDAGDGRVRIIFSRRGGMAYQDFRDYLTHLRSLQEAAGEEEATIYWPAIDIEGVEALDHETRAGLQFADMVAGAFNRAVEPDAYGNPEPRYAQLLAPRVIGSASGIRIGYGVKPVPGLDQMTLTEAQRAFFDWYKRVR